MIYSIIEDLIRLAIYRLYFTGSQYLIFLLGLDFGDCIQISLNLLVQFLASALLGSLLNELSLQEYADEVTEINLSDTENLYLITQEGISVRMGDGEYLRAKVGAIRTYIAYFRQLGTDSGVLDVSIPEDGKFMPER